MQSQSGQQQGQNQAVQQQQTYTIGGDQTQQFAQNNQTNPSTFGQQTNTINSNFRNTQQPQQTFGQSTQQYVVGGNQQNQF